MSEQPTPPLSDDDLIPPRPVVRPWLKPVLWIASFFLFWVLVIAGWRIYRRQQPRILAERAQAAFKAGDTRTASVLLVRALQINPESLDAVVTLAEIYDRAGLSEAVNWWDRAVELAPEVARYRLDLAQTAIRHGRLAQARHVLAKVPAEIQKTADYLGLLGALEFGVRNFAEAQKHFAAARALAPTNQEYLLNEANARLNQARTRSEGEPILAEIAALATTAGPSRLSALRVLRTNYANLRDFPEALKASKLIVEDPGAIPPDRLAHLTILYLAKDPAFPAGLDAARKIGLTSPFEAAAVAHWMRTLGLHREALEWSDSLPADIGRHAEIASNLALSANALQDWNYLAKIVDVPGENPWGATEYLRLALLARAQRAKNAAQLSQSSWNRAVTAAMRVRAGGAELARLAQMWGWKAELGTVLWRTVETNRPEAEEALAALFSLAEKDLDTRGLLRVFQAMSLRRPEDGAISNNFALLALLLRQSSERAQQVAEENYRKNPQVPAFMLTQAFALLRKGEIAKAVELVRSLPPAEPAENARRAPYVAAILRAGGDATTAQQVARAAEGAVLLPEERELLQSSRL